MENAKCGTKVKIEIELNNEKDYIINNMDFYYEDSKVLEKCYDMLSKNQVNLEEISSSEYEGKVKTEKEGTYILFTIPYDEGWKITVDGKEVETLVMQDALMGIFIEGSGEHEIKMNFVPKRILCGNGNKCMWNYFIYN